MKPKSETILLLAILGGGLIIRLLPIATAMPFAESLDETDYIETALRFGAGHFRISSLVHGGLFQMTLFAAYAGYFILGRIVGLFGSASDFLLSYIRNPSPFYSLARAIPALCGTGVAWLSFSIASRLSGERTGLIACLFTTFSLLMLQMSFLALADLPSVFLLMLAAHLLFRSVERPPEQKEFFTAAALIGLAAACKFHAGFGIVTLYAAAYMKASDSLGKTKTFFRLASLGSFMVLVGFCIGIPQFLLDPLALHRDVFLRLGTQYVAANTIRHPWMFVLTHHLRNGLGIPLSAAVLLGIGFALYRRTRGDLLALSFPAAFSLLMMHSVGFAYHWVPAAPFLLILAARFLDAAVRRFYPQATLTACLCIAAVVAAPTGLDSMRLLSVMLSPDTRTAANEWIGKNLPADETILAEGYILTVPFFCPPLVEDRPSLERDVASVMAVHGSGLIAKMRLADYLGTHPSPIAHNIFKVRNVDKTGLGKEKPRFIIMSSALDNPTEDEASYYVSEEYYAERKAAKEEIRRRYDVIATFSPSSRFSAFFPHLADADYRSVRGWPVFTRGRLRGPTITILERKTHDG